MCKICKHPADVRIRFQRIDNQFSPKGGLTDYLMITFSSIGASVRVEGIWDLSRKE